eukprot:4604341-Alexandrium_andersonii.AAC.1
MGGKDDLGGRQAEHGLLLRLQGAARRRPVQHALAVATRPLEHVMERRPRSNCLGLHAAAAAAAGAAGRRSSNEDALELVENAVEVQ